jgi:hypothetical protein
MADDVAFPDCFIDVLLEQLATIDGVTSVVDRALGAGDANGTIGVSYETWQPKEVEMGGRGGFDPTISEYILSIEHLVKAGDRVTGNRDCRSVAKSIRSMLYRDADTQLRLRQLKHIDADGIERILKWKIVQHFASNKFKDAFYFVSETVVTLDTDKV